MKNNIDPETLEKLRTKAAPNTKWAAYQNVAMDSSLLGHFQFLMVGEGCTFAERPEKMPDTAFDLGWKYKFVGFVDLEAGVVKEEPHG